MIEDVSRIHSRNSLEIVRNAWRASAGLASLRIQSLSSQGHLTIRPGFRNTRPSSGDHMPLIARWKALGHSRFRDFSAI